VLADQRKQLTTMLTALSDLGKVGTRVINASKADTIANLRALDPILNKLAEAGANLPGALEMLVTYPFPQAATGAVQGDYTNLRITADLDLRNILTNLNGGKNPPLPSLPPLPTGLPTGLPTKLPTGLPTKLPTGVPTLPIPSLPTPSLTIPPLPSAPGTGGGSTGGGRTCVGGICIGAPAGSTAGAYNTNLARLMMGGLA
jgi:phospholipid/cholesterol/gamma-HCH transport system substrate-binding protein